MNVLGWFLAVCGLVGVIFGFMQSRKGKRLASAPFKRPSEIAQLGASASGMVSTEGQTNLGPQPLVAPMSGEPCVAYEITVERKWERIDYGENGETKSTGKESVFRDAKGAVFQITDGGGSVMVDATRQPDVAYESSHSSTMPIGMMIPGVLQFGHMEMPTPAIGGEGSTTAFVGTEKIVRPTQTMFAMGALAPGPHGPTLGTPAGLGTGKLMLSPRGRDALLGSTARNAKLGFVLGGLVTVGGGSMGALAPSGGGGGTYGCDFTNAGTCASRISRSNQRAGENFTWTVTQPGVYRLHVNPPAHVRYPLDPILEVLQNGAVLAMNDDAPEGDTHDSLIERAFAAGTYTLRVKSFTGNVPRDGFSFEMQATLVSSADGGAVATDGGALADPDTDADGGAAVPAAADAAAATAATPGDDDSSGRHHGRSRRRRHGH